MIHYIITTFNRDTKVNTETIFILFIQRLEAENNTQKNSSSMPTDKYWCRFAREKYSIKGFHVAFFISSYAIPLLLIIGLYVIMLQRYGSDIKISIVCLTYYLNLKSF